MVGFEIFEQRLGFVEGEDVATLRRGVQLVRELRFDAGTFIGERERFTPAWIKYPINSCRNRRIVSSTPVRVKPSDFASTVPMALPSTKRR